MEKTILIIFFPVVIVLFISENKNALVYYNIIFYCYEQDFE